MSGQSQDESHVIKSVLQVTLEPSEAKNGFVFLNKLYDKMNTVNNIANSFSTPSNPSPPPNSIEAILKSTLSSLIPQPAPQTPQPQQPVLDLIPCERCGKLYPMDKIFDHESLCGLVPEASLPQQSMTAPPVNLPPAQPTNPTPLPKSTKIDRTMIGALLQERILMFAGNNGGFKMAGKFLLESYDRASQLIKKEGKVDENSVLSLLKKEILTHTKDLSVVECTRIAQSRNHANAKDLINFYGGFLETPNNEFYNELVTTISEKDLNTIFGTILIELSFEMRTATRNKNMLQNEHVPILNRLAQMSNDPRILKALGNLVSKESLSAATCTAREMENSSALVGFMGVTCILSSYDKNAFHYFSTLLSRYPQCSVQEVQSLQDNLRNKIRESVNIVHGVVKKLFVDKELKEPTLSWVGAFLQLNDTRANINPVDPLSFEINLVLSTDGFMIFLLEILLNFCKPFMDPKAPKVSMIQSTYCPQSHRYDFSKQPKLAQFSELDLSLGEAPTFNFISETFFATLYAVHVGLMSTISHYNSILTLYNQNRNQIESLKAKFGDSWSATPQGQKLQDSFNKIHEWLDSFATQLLDPEFLRLLCQFSLLTMNWMLTFTPTPGTKEISVETKKLYSHFPEFYVKDIADLLTFFIRYKPDIVLEIPEFLQKIIDYCVTLLNFPTLVKSPIIRAKLTTILSEIVYKKQFEEQKVQKSGWGMISPLAIQYASAFQENKLAQTSLSHGLMLIYVDADIVEGLDVDKENFDKYSLRRNIALLLNDLWNMSIFKTSFKKEATSNHFSKFINTVMNDSIHTLEDSLGRLVDIRTLQLAMADKEEWDKQDQIIKDERQRYYEIQENSSRGFLSLANSCLDILVQLTREPDIVPSFIEPQTVGRVAAMLNHFFVSLCGPKCNNLKVNNPEKYSFSPKNLLMKITQITLSFVGFPAFIDTMSKEIDYSGDVMKQAHFRLIQNKIVHDADAQKFLEFVAKVESKLQVTEAPVVSPADLPSTPTIMELDLDTLEKHYVAELEDKRFDSFDMKVEGSEKYNHHYASNIETSSISALSGSRMQRIVKECTMMATSLPISLSSSIFVRADEERMDVLKALIIGPMGTPYSIGCFQFDIFLPPTYPMDPPLCNMETTGNGTVRFNPNLYNCGKVCLSLLGTWHGDQNSKWNAVSSTIHQVLVSIQALILVDQPYFNEPAYDSQKGTKEGELRSKEYNESIRLSTLRHAILGQLRNPSQGFEEIIKTHFRIQKDRLLNQCEEWRRESSDENSAKFERSIEDLKKELTKLS